MFPYEKALVDGALWLEHFVDDFFTSLHKVTIDVHAPVRYDVDPGDGPVSGSDSVAGE